MFVRLTAHVVASFLVVLVLHLLVTGLGLVLRRRTRLVPWIGYGVTALCAGATLFTRNAFYDIRCWADCGIPPIFADLPLALTRAGVALDVALALLGFVAGAACAAYGLARRAVYSRSIVLTALTALTCLAAASIAAFGFPLAVGEGMPLTEGLFLATSSALTALGVSVASASARASARATRVERLAEQLSRVSDAGSTEIALGDALGDATLAVRFPLGTDGDLLDASGHAAGFIDAAHRRRVQIRRAGAAIAYITLMRERVALRAAR